MNSNCTPTITKALVANLKLEDLYDGELVLYSYCLEAWGEDSELGYLSQELTMLKSVPQKLGYYYLIFRMDGLCGDGGMRTLALEYAPAENAEVLRLTAEAFRSFGDTETGNLIDQLVPVSLSAAEKLANLEARKAPEPELQAVRATIDAFDGPFEAVRRKSDVYAAILADMHYHPEAYIP